MATLHPQQPATEDDIVAYARRHGIPIPAPVVATLSRWNAADAREYAVPVPGGNDTSGLQFLGISGPTHLDLATAARGSWRRGQAWLFPIGFDAGGNVFAVSTRALDAGTVWFIDHDTNEAALAFPSVEALVDGLKPAARRPESEWATLLRTATLANIQARAQEMNHYKFVNSAAKYDREDVLRWLVSIPGAHASGALAQSARVGNVEAVGLLLRCGVPVDDSDKMGMTGLMWAANQGYATVVDLLLANGANTTLRSRVPNRTAADWADSGGYTDIAAKLRNPARRA